MGYYITSTDDFSHTLIGTVGQNITLNSKITLELYTRVLFMNIPNSKDGALLAIAPGNKIITAFRNNGVWEEKSSHFIATKSDLYKVAKIDRSTSSAWVGDNDNNMIFNCNFNNKTLIVTFTDGKTVTFQGK